MGSIWGGLALLFRGKTRLGNLREWWPNFPMTSPGPFSLSPTGYVIRDANLHAVAILAARNETTADGKLLTAAPRMREALKKIEGEVAGMVHAFPAWEPALAEIRGALLAAGGAS